MTERSTVQVELSIEVQNRLNRARKFLDLPETTSHSGVIQTVLETHHADFDSWENDDL